MKNWKTCNLTITYIYRRERREGALGPPPPLPNLGKKFCSEISKRGENVPPRYIGKNECARSAQIKEMKKDDSRLSEI